MESTITKDKWIIDTDPGCDDMMCLIYMLNKTDIDIEMISLVEGNTTMKNVEINIRKIIKLVGRRVPIYKGQAPIMKGCPNAVRAHMVDGLGDIPELIKLDYSDVLIEQENTALKMIELIHKYPMQISILMIGPLTNLALAYMLDPTIVDKVKSVVIMGGAIFSRGNILPASEFNFSYDYIAPNVVINNFKRIVIVPWEPIEPHRIIVDHMDQLKNKLDKSKQKYNEGSFFYAHKMIHKFTKELAGMRMCDLYCAITQFNKKVVKKCFLARCQTIIDADVLRGALIIKDRIIINDFDKALNDLLTNEKYKDYHLVVESMEFEVILKELETLFIIS